MYSKIAPQVLSINKKIVTFLSHFVCSIVVFIALLTCRIPKSKEFFIVEQYFASPSYVRIVDEFRVKYPNVEVS